MSGGPDITEWPSLKAAWGLFLSCRVWGCCAAHRRQASSYTNRANLGASAMPAAVAYSLVSAPALQLTGMS